MKKTERQHLERVSSMGCIVCRLEGYGYSPAECHHIRSGKGTTRATHFEVIPLCPNHHRNGGPGIAIHSGRKTWEEKYKTEKELLEITLNELEEF